MLLLLDRGWSWRHHALEGRVVKKRSSAGAAEAEEAAEEAEGLPAESAAKSAHFRIWRLCWHQKFWPPMFLVPSRVTHGRKWSQKRNCFRRQHQLQDSGMNGPWHRGLAVQSFRADL